MSKKMLIKKVIVLLLGSAFTSTISAATISGGDYSGGGYTGFEDVTITSNTPKNNLAASYEVSNMFDGIWSSSSIMIFDEVGQGGVAFVEFQTDSLVQLNAIKLQLQEDGATTGARSASAWAFYANTTGTSFGAGDLISSGVIDPDYAGAYNNSTITITDDDISKTARFFRLELIQADTDGRNSGIRAVELGANLTVIPEPSQTSAFVGVVLLAFTLRRQYHRC